MRLIILPLAEKGLEDEREQRFVFPGLLVITDKFIDRSDAEKIRREITMMTKVGRSIFEDGSTEGYPEGGSRAAKGSMGQNE